MCLCAQVIEDNNGSVVRVGWYRGLSDDGVGVGRGRGIRDTSGGSETTTEEAGDKR